MCEGRPVPARINKEHMVRDGLWEHREQTGHVLLEVKAGAAAEERDCICSRPPPGAVLEALLQLHASRKHPLLLHKSQPWCTQWRRAQA